MHNYLIKVYATIVLCVIYRMPQEERSMFWEIIVPVILSKNVYMSMCPIPNGFRDRATWMYNRKIVDKKEILRVRTVSNTCIFCSSDGVDTVYNECSKIPPSLSMYFATRAKTWRVVHLSASWRSFMQAITSSMLTSSSSRVSTFFLYTSLFIKPHKQKSKGVMSGDLGGQLMLLPWPIHLLGKVSLRCISCRVWEGAPSCCKYIAIRVAKGTSSSCFGNSFCTKLSVEFSNTYYKLYQLCHLNNKHRYQKRYVHVISLSYQQFCGCTFK